ncbi:MAG: DUF192 domain-containing protein, partial [Burkholderiaceae bacterium]
MQPEAVAIRFEYPGRPDIAMRVVTALDFVSRLRGLIGQQPPDAGTGLWIEPCAGIHTFGMRAAIDLVFVSRDRRVRRIDDQVPPHRLRGCRGARAVIEMRAG